MATPDVRVRLSAEGVAEVVAALKRIQSEGQSASDKGKRSFLDFNSVLGNTRSLLTGLGVAFGVSQIVSFIRNAGEAADEMGKLSQKVGASVANLSALQFAATTADVSSEQLTQGLVILNRRLGEVQEGAQAPTSALRDLGLTLDDFKGKDAAERFDLVARHLGGMEAGFKKTQLAVALFGRGGAQLIPLLNDLSGKGLAKAREEAAALGLVLDDDVVAAVTQMNDDLAVLSRQTQFFAAQFLGGLAPSIAQGATIISGSLGDAGKSFQEFGEGVGTVLRFVVGIVATAFDQVGTSIGTLAVRLAGLVKGVSRSLKGEFKEALDEIRAANKFADEEQARLAQRTANRFKAITTTPPALPSGAGTEPPESEAAQRAAEASRAALDNELAIVKAQARARTEVERRSFDEGLSNLLQFYTARRQIIDESADFEVATLLKKKALLGAETDEIKAQTEAKRIDAEIQKIRIEQQAEIAALTFEEAKATRDLSKEGLAIEQRILETQGRRHGAQKLAIEEEVAAAEKLFRQQGFSAEQARLGAERLRQSLTADADFDEAQRRARAALNELSLARREIDAQVQAGQMTQLQGEQQLLALERARIVTLKELAAALLAAAEGTGDPDKIAEAREFAQAVGEIEVSAVRAENAMTRFRDALEQSGLSALEDFFADGITSAKNFGDAVKQMALSVIQSIRRVAAELLARRIFQGIAGLFGGAPVPSPAQASGGLVGRAPIRRSSGGLLQGPGTGTSDSILAMTTTGRGVRFSTNEFVVRELVTRQPGALAFLEDFNRHGMRALKPITATVPRFAEGGLIEAGLESHAPRDGRLVVEHSEDVVLRVLESPEGQRLVLRTLARNPRAVQQATRAR